MLLSCENSALLLIDVQEKLVPHILDSDNLLTRCEWLLKLANRLNVPVLASEQYPKGLGNTISQLSGYYEVTMCVEKIDFSCMQEPTYRKKLAELNKPQSVIIGIEAHVCVLQTAMELKLAGQDVFVVVDAVSSRNAMDLRYGLKRMKQAGVHLITAEMVFFEWVRKAGTAEFKALSREFLQS